MQNQLNLNPVDFALFCIHSNYCSYYMNTINYCVYESVTASRNGGLKFYSFLFIYFINVQTHELSIVIMCVYIHKYDKYKETLIANNEHQGVSHWRNRRRYLEYGHHIPTYSMFLHISNYISNIFNIPVYSVFRSHS